MIYIFIWLVSSALVFAWLRVLALRDFGNITVGGAILLALYSLLTPAALIAAFIIWLMGSKGFFGKTVWTRR